MEERFILNRSPLLAQAGVFVYLELPPATWNLDRPPSARAGKIKQLVVSERLLPATVALE